MKRRIISFNLAICILFSLFPALSIEAFADTSNSYNINGVSLHYDDSDYYPSAPSDCWSYANKVYRKIWGVNFDSTFDQATNYLRNLSDDELTLTSEHLKQYVSKAAVGSVIRVCNVEYLHAFDNWGHSQIIVQKDDDGFTVFEGGLPNYPHCQEKYYTWDSYYYLGKYNYIKYIKWEGAGGTYSSSSLSVLRTVSCDRTLQLPARKIYLYGNATDTSIYSSGAYFDFGPKLYTYEYAEMSDGSIRYKIWAEHRGESRYFWLVHASDIQVTENSKSYWLDVNGLLDGSVTGGTDGYGTFDVYIDGARVAQGVSDYYTQWKEGTSFEIKNIKPSNGCTYRGVYTGGSASADLDLYEGLTGTLNKYNGSGAPDHS